MRKARPCRGELVLGSGNIVEAVCVCVCMRVQQSNDFFEYHHHILLHKCSLGGLSYLGPGTMIGLPGLTTSWVLLSLSHVRGERMWSHSGCFSRYCSISPVSPSR